MLVLPNQRLHKYFPCCFLPASFFFSSTYTDNNSSFFSVNETHSQFGIFPNRVSIGSSQIVVPMIVLPKDDRTDSVQDERRGLPCWTIIWAIRVVVDESKCLDIPISEFSIICEHLPFSLGYKQILRQLLVLRNQAVWIWYPWLLLQSFVMMMNLVQWIPHKTQNRLLQYHLGVQLDLYIFGALPPIQHSLLHRSPLSYFWLSSATPESFQVSLILYPLLRLLRVSSWLEA